MVFAPLRAAHDQQSSLERQNLPDIYPSPETVSTDLNGVRLQTAIMAANHQQQAFRKDSMVNNSDSLPGYDSNISKWNQKYDIQPFGTDHSVTFAPTNPFYTPDHIFNRQDTTNTASATAHNDSHDQSWPYEQPVQKASPDQFDNTNDFDITEYTPHGLDQSYPAFTPIQRKHGYVQTAQTQAPISPLSHADWASPSAEEPKRLSLQRQMRPNTQVRSISECARPDGIRKKNTRIDIPPERSLVAIEQLLEDTKDDEERKELKGQRRLLRNREAALASRQRKKKHTEDLEVKEKNYLGQISELENRLHDMHVRYSQAEQQRQFMVEQNMEMHHAIDALRAEKQDLIFAHTRETSVLRRQIEYLNNENEHGPAPTMSAAPSSNGQNEFASDFNALHMDSHPWDDFMAQEQRDLSHRPKDPLTLTRTDNNALHQQVVQTSSQHGDPPVATGVLFMLLLCGAFVASRPNSSPSVPRMPDEVRAASTTVLDSLLKDSRADGLSLPAGGHSTHVQMNVEPQPSLAFGTFHPRTSTGEPRMDNLHRSLTAPTRAQEVEQLFALTPAEYAALNGHDTSSLFDDSPSVNTAPRHNLAEVLANFRQESVSKGGAAEIYTRSLLWDQIPTEVVKQFKELVKDSQKADCVPFGYTGAAQKH